MSEVVEVVTPTVVFEIAVWDNFGKFETESCFSVGLELFFALEGRLSIHFLTTGCIQDLSPLQDLVPLCIVSFFPTIFEVLLFFVVPRRILSCSKLCEWIDL